MRIAINGTGVAGPTLAFWLQRHGHEPVLFEQAPALRTGGYVVDFWGVGFDVAERMGLVPALREQAYAVRELRMVDEHGRAVASTGFDETRRAIGDRLLTIARGDLAATVYRACEAAGVQARFGVAVTGIDEQPDGVAVALSDGTTEGFDLVVGADGLHSAVRALTFGPEARFERDLGCYVAAVRLPGYRPRDELVYVGHTAPKRQAMRMALRGNDTMALFIFRSELLDHAPTDPAAQRAALRHVFGGMRWEVPAMLDQLDDAPSLYFDHVSQIRMARWSSGRVALVGDAAACVSLLAGEGTGLAMTEAYVLAGELRRADGDHARAFAAYHAALAPLLARKQTSALSFLGFFAPRTRLGMAVRDLVVRASGTKFVARNFVVRTLRDDFALPDYASVPGGA